jgi:sugar phosphate isomerase/epimerase
MLDYAAACGAKHVTTLPGVRFAGESRDRSLARCTAELAWRVGQSQAAGLEFGVEAHVGSIAATPGAALDPIGRVPGLTLTLDYTHFTRAGIPDRRVEPLVRHASHLHMRCACRGRLQCNFKENTIGFSGMLKAMQVARYHGWAGVEYIWIDWERCNESDTLSETILLGNHLRKLAAKL